MSKRAVNLLRNMAVPMKRDGTNPNYGFNKVISVTAARTLTAAESGAIIHWTHSSAHNITLPAAVVGLNFEFVLLAGAAANHHILSQSADKIFGKVIVNSTADDDSAVQVVLKGSAVDKVFMHKTGATSGGDAGDTVKLICCEAGYWVCNANLISTNANPSSIATLTD